MLVTVPRADLRQLLGSLDQLARAWPDHAQEVAALVFTLRVSRPSLAEALQTGLVSLDDGISPPAGHIRLGHGSARLTAQALHAATGRLIHDAHVRPYDVTGLAIQDVAVAGALAS